ncbi:hypothetical protein NYQ83_12110 [Afifella sp. JA880]|uniref:hypothetical protein n=1 Tax=Afifella sp. JA880 TaxID=2975280 RepID=UPI0021BA88D1|nr:hypothetical protein [Afifella sp. JA880]MCT8268019.1 hypothetical protein [Afifella sp. JA880]
MGQWLVCQHSSRGRRWRAGVSEIVPSGGSGGGEGLISSRGLVAIILGRNYLGDGVSRHFAQ